MTVPVLATELDGVAGALERAVQMRRRGAAFEVALRLPDDRAAIANLAARDVCEREPDRARRAARFADLGAHDARLGRAMLEDLSTVPVERRVAARTLVSLARAVQVVSAPQEWQIIMGLDGTFRRRRVRTADAGVPVPGGRSAAGDRIVLWAPRAPTERFVLAIAGACADGAPVDAVCMGGDRFGYDVRIVAPADGEASLAQANVIVAVDADDCAEALALAAWQRPLCAPATSGVDYWIRGVTTYRPWSAAGLTSAIEMARARPARFDEIRPPEPEEPEPDPEALRTGPPVRIIVRSSRAAPSAPTAAALALLTYTPLEVVVAGSAAEATEAARRDGAAYVVTLDDGDAPFPEAVSRLVAILETTGADAAAGELLLAFVGMAGSEPAYAIAEGAVPARIAAHGLAPRVLVRRAWFLDPNAAGTLVLRDDSVLAVSYRAA